MPQNIVSVGATKSNRYVLLVDNELLGFLGMKTGGVAHLFTSHHNCGFEILLCLEI